VQRRTSPLLPVQARLRSFLIDEGQIIIDELGRGFDDMRPKQVEYPSGSGSNL